MRLAKFLSLFVIITLVFGWGPPPRIPNFFLDSYNYVAVITESAVCYFKECCSSHSIPADFDGLEKSLEKHVYGQHLMQEVVVNALRAHFDNRTAPKKALTLSFHGWPGSGKNYVTNYIIKHLYKEGDKSKFVHHFIGRTHFPQNESVSEYQMSLYQWIKGNLTRCGRQLFVFDEVEKIPPGVLDGIKPIIDYRGNVDGFDGRQSIFIFLSNTGSNLIIEHYVDLWFKRGKKREDLKMSDFENMITAGAFNEVGGFYMSDNIRSNLIDHYIPFLPLERHHVRMCILDEFRQRNIANPSEAQIIEAMDFIQWGPSDVQLLSTTGCKRVSSKVASIVSKYKF